MKIGVAAPACLLLTTACCESNAPAPKTVVITCIDGGDAGSVEPFEADQSPEALGVTSPCARACRNMSMLGCPESAKLPGGKTCVETCKDISTISSFSPQCVESAKTVDAVRKCPQVSCKK